MFLCLIGVFVVPYFLGGTKDIAEGVQGIWNMDWELDDDDENKDVDDDNTNDNDDKTNDDDIITNDDAQTNDDDDKTNDDDNTNDHDDRTNDDDKTNDDDQTNDDDNTNNNDDKTNDDDKTEDEEDYQEEVNEKDDAEEEEQEDDKVEHQETEKKKFEEEEGGQKENEEDEEEDHEKEEDGDLTDVIANVLITEITGRSSHDNTESETSNAASVDVTHPQEVKTLPQKEKMELKFTDGDLYEFQLSLKERLILRKLQNEVQEFTKFYNVRLILPDGDVQEAAFLEGAENRVQMAFLHIQEILDEFEREGHDVDMEELSLHQETEEDHRQEVQQNDNILCFADALKRKPEQPVVKHPTYVIVRRRTLPLIEELPLEDYDEDDSMEEMNYSEFDDEDDWDFEDEEDDWDLEEPRHKVIVGISLREAPEEEGKGGMTRRLVPKTLRTRENELPLEEKAEDKTLPTQEEEKVPLEDKQEEEHFTQEVTTEKEATKGDAEECVLPQEGVEENTCPQEEEECVLPRGEKEESSPIEISIKEEQNDGKHEEMKPVTREDDESGRQEAGGKKTFANIVKIIPEKNLEKQEFTACPCKHP
ncbi:midasin-like [Macrobrachium nipponense]|uniref:midasin-like n=1 Tax=Macrobrachium nipponense TaxID=159736 RepID=UPI0030C804BB